MKKLITLCLLIVIAAVPSFAQSPDGVNYQAVVRDGSGQLVTSTVVGMRLSILQGSSSGTAVYTETHLPTTNGYGLVNVALGDGSTSDDFSTIDWGNGPYFIRLEIDVTGGTSYQLMGASQLLSVPYALYARSVEDDMVDDADADPANELVTGFSLNGNSLDLTDAGGTMSADLSALVDDADANPTNELITGLTLTGTTLNVTDAGGTTSANLSNLVDDSDADPSNELQTLSLSGNDLTLSQNGGTVTLGSGGDSSLWELDNDTVYVDGPHVGIGTDGGNSMLNAYSDVSGVYASIHGISETSGVNRGIAGRTYSTTSSSSSQFGVVGVAEEAPGASGSGYGNHTGVTGEAYASNANSYGVQGWADGGGDDNMGFIGRAESDGLIRNYGAQLVSYGESVDYWNMGSLNVATGSHTGTNYGVYAIAQNADTNYAGYFAGDLAYTGSLINASDRALKTNISELTNALDKVNKVGTYSYTYKSEAYPHMSLPTTPQIGFIAQELEQVFPELVFNQKAPTSSAWESGKVEGEAFTRYKGVNYIGMIPVLTKAIQEQQEIIEQQADKIEELESRLEALEN